MIRNCRKMKFRGKLSDSTGMELTGGKLLAATMVMRRLLLRHVLTPDEKYVGILLPPSLGGVIANAALSMTGRVTVNLELHGDAGRAQFVHRAGPAFAES